MKKSIYNSIGAQLIVAERNRQVTREGWSEDHDDKHASGELADAAIAYVMAAAKLARGESLEFLRPAVDAGAFPWPWEDEWWKPSGEPIRNLEKAGALIAAEIDRLIREKSK